MTGARGQLGSEVVRSLQDAGMTALAPARDELDFLLPDSIATCIARLRPDWIVNCAAYTQVDRAESEPETAFAVNRDAAGRLAQAAVARGARLLHVSTDFVFNGRQTRPYRETDAPDPLGVYGRSKLEGEAAVVAALPDAAIVRTAWVYGVHGHNFVKTMLRVAGQGKPLRVVADQIGSPTWAADIAAALLRLLAAQAHGVYHFAGAGQTSWHGFAQAILDRAVACGFDLATRTVEPITTADYPTAAVRPAYSVLDTGKIAGIPGVVVPAWQDSLENMLKELRTCADCW
ncbi:MAG: dTDP-4-dehydrorhamnose reductase [Pseudomonadota bacterium]